MTGGERQENAALSFTVTVAGSTARVDVGSGSRTLAELARLVAPFAGTARPGPADPAPPARVSALDHPPAGQGWEQAVLTSAYEPDRVLWTRPAERHIAVVGPESDWRTQQALRAVRNLLRWQVYARGELFVHGGLVRLEGKGVAFLGRKKSGKSSSILSALLTGGAEFVSNDDVVLADGGWSPDGGPNADGRLTGYGFPRSVNLRTDALLALADAGHTALRGLITGGAHPVNRFQGRHLTEEALRLDGRTLPGSVWVRPTELAAVTERPLRASAPLDAVVFPGFRDGLPPRLRRLDPEEAAGRLRENIEPHALKYDEFLAGWYPVTDEERREGLVRRLVESTPCFELTQDMHDLAAATRLIMTETGRDGADTSSRHRPASGTTRVRQSAPTPPVTGNPAVPPPFTEARAVPPPASFTHAAFDLDGTLCDEAGKFPGELADALHALRAAGIRPLLVTGRSVSTFRMLTHDDPVLEALEPAVVLNDGNTVLDRNDGTVTVLRALPPGLPRWLAEHGVEDFVAETGGGLVAASRKAAAGYTIAHGLPRGSVPVGPLPADAEAVTQIAVLRGDVRALPHWQDMGFDVTRLTAFRAQLLTPAGTCKAAGLHSWLDGRRSDPVVLAAFGDAYNDGCLLRGAALGVAVPGADSVARRNADVILEQPLHEYLAALPAVRPPTAPEGPPCRGDHARPSPGDAPPG
ncbi:HAD hydrolase family protein [Streptomyces sp. NPDC047973]|uniref:HAD hydrolase family protein n=1 Tax=Streptomyces sp. NPDC047973 TaxID=3155383 RepID=UPI00343518A0